MSYLSVYAPYTWGLQRPEEDVGSPWSRYEPLCLCWEPIPAQMLCKMSKFS